MSPDKHISIIGAGFAALTAAREMRKQLPAAKITLIAPSPEFIYYPGLIWVPTGLRSGDDLRFDILPLLKKLNVRFHQGRVSRLADQGRRVLTDSGEIQNDALLIASGGRFIKKLPGIEQTLTVCEGIPAAKAMRDRLNSLSSGTIAIGFGANPKEPGAMRGGPMFELLFGIDTWLRQQGRRSAVDLVFFNAGTEPGKRLGDKAVKRMLSEMSRRGIETRLGYKPEGFDVDGVLTDKGKIPADMMLFMPGMTGPDWAASTGLPLSEGGFFQADAHCRVQGAERVYVAGDSGSYPGPGWLPKQAHMADLQAKTAVQNIAAELQGRTASARFTTELICIVDSLDKGMLIFRNESRSLMLPPMRLLHWTKRLFEWLYLRPLR